MKSVKRITIIFVICIIVIGCQTNDDLIEIENLVSGEKQTKMETTEILLDFNGSASHSMVEYVRDAFDDYLTIVSHYSCSGSAK